jgi:hypothetical protein
LKGEFHSSVNPTTVRAIEEVQNALRRFRSNFTLTLITFANETRFVVRFVPGIRCGWLERSAMGQHNSTTLYRATNSLSMPLSLHP